MKVILKQDIPNVGDAGEVKEVSDGFARNYLIPKKLVIPYSPSSNKALEHQRKIIEIKKAKRRKEVEEIAKSFDVIKTLEIPVRVGAKSKLFGSVTTSMIAKAIEEKTGKTIDKRKIQLNDNIKQIGEYNINLHLSSDVKIPIKLKVIPHPDSNIEEVLDSSSNRNQENTETNPN